MFCIFFITTFLGMLLAIPLFNLSLKEINELIINDLDSANNAFIKYIQAVQSIGFFVLPGWIFWHIFSYNVSKTTSHKSKINEALTYILIFLTVISLVPVINLLMRWNSSLQFPSYLSDLENTLQNLEENAARITEKILSGESLHQYLINVFIIAVLPAVGEEFIFRGVLQRLLTDWIKHGFIAILFTSLIFSAFHLQFYGFIPRLLLGMYFGYLYYWSKNIWLVIWAHFLNNALAVTLFFLTNKGIDIFPGYFGENSLTVTSLLIGTALSILLLWITRVRTMNLD
jgi:hypothetical protein